MGGKEVVVVVGGSDLLSASLFLDPVLLLSFLPCTRARFISHVSPSLNPFHHLKRLRCTNRFPKDNRLHLYNLLPPNFK